MPTLSYMAGVDGSSYPSIHEKVAAPAAGAAAKSATTTEAIQKTQRQVQVARFIVPLLTSDSADAGDHIKALLKLSQAGWSSGKTPPWLPPARVGRAKI
jgi:hypothetical protein